MAVKRFVAACHDVGASQVLSPIIRLLQEAGHEVTVLTEPAAPARDGFIRGGVQPVLPECPSLTASDFTILFRSIRPHAVLSGTGSEDDTCEKAALRAAHALGIPTAVPLESWPHHWIELYGERDKPLYQQVNRIFIPDDCSRDFLLENGFAPERVIASGNPLDESLAKAMEQRETVRAEFRARHRIPSDAIVVTWLLNLDLDDPATHKPDHPEWYGVPEEELVREFLLAVQDAAAQGAPVHGVIRQKPTYGCERIQRLIAEVNPTVTFDIDRALYGLPALFASDVTFGTGTMMIQTAAKTGIPGIYYTPQRSRPEDMITNEIGLTAPLREDGGMRKIILEAAANGVSALAPYRSRIPFSLPADASRRIADEVLAISLSSD